MGLVDDEHTVGSMPGPKEHIFLAEKAAWWTVDEGDGLERYENFINAFQKRLKDWEVRGKPPRADV